MLPKGDTDALAEHSKAQKHMLRGRGEAAPDLSDMQDEVQANLATLQSKVVEVFEEFGQAYKQQYSGKHVILVTYG